MAGARAAVVVLTALHKAEVGLLDAAGSSMLAPWAFPESPPSRWKKLYDDQREFSELLLCLGQH